MGRSPHLSCCLRSRAKFGVYPLGPSKVTFLEVQQHHRWENIIASPQVSPGILPMTPISLLLKDGRCPDPLHQWLDEVPQDKLDRLIGVVHVWLSLSTSRVIRDACYLLPFPSVWSIQIYLLWLLIKLWVVCSLGLFWGMDSSMNVLLRRSVNSVRCLPRSSISRSESRWEGQFQYVRWFSKAFAQPMLPPIVWESLLLDTFANTWNCQS